MGHRRAFDEAFVDTLHQLTDLVFETIDHRRHLDDFRLGARAPQDEVVVLIPGCWYLDQSVRTCNFRRDGRLGSEGRADDGGGAILVLQQSVAAFVGACYSQFSRGQDILRFAQEQQAKEQGIDADVQQGAAAQRQVEQAVIGMIGAGKTKVGPYVLYRAKPA